MSINLLWSSHYSESFTVPSLLVWTLSPRRVTKESVGNDQEIELDSGAWSNVVREGWLRGDRGHWAEPVFSIRRSTTGRIEIFSASLFWTSLGWLLLKMKRGTSSWVNYHVWRWAVGRLSCPLQQVSCELSWISVAFESHSKQHWRGTKPRHHKQDEKCHLLQLAFFAPGDVLKLMSQESKLEGVDCLGHPHCMAVCSWPLDHVGVPLLALHGAFND